jgi:hypothetical protein
MPNPPSSLTLFARGDLNLSVLCCVARAFLSFPREKRPRPQVRFASKMLTDKVGTKIEFYPSFCKVYPC